MTRRAFLKTSGAVGAALGLLPYARVLGANDDIRVAVVGFRSDSEVAAQVNQLLRRKYREPFVVPDRV